MTTETTDPGSDDTPQTTRSMGRGRRIGVVLLILLASVLLFGTAAEVWVKQQLLSTSKWVAASDKVLADPQVQEALSTYIVDQIYANVDVQKELADKLPGDWQGIAGPIAAGIRTPATSVVERILGSERVEKIWHNVNEKAHTALVNVLEDKTKVGSTKDGKVTLDIGEIVRIVGTDLGIPASIMDKVPADVGQITIFESSSLATVQTAVKIINVLGPVLFVVILALYSLAVWLARGRRRLTLRNIGWSIIIVGLLLTAMRRLTGNYIDSIISSDQYSVAAKIVFSILSELLYDTAWILISWGLIIVVGMLVIGPSRIAVWARRTVAPVMNADATIFWVGAAVLYLLVLLIVPSPALRLWWSVVLIGAVVALGLEVLRRRSQREFPESRLDFDVDGIRQSATRTWSSVTARFQGDAAEDHVARLERLSALHDAGALTDEEFAAAKATLLD